MIPVNMAWLHLQNLQYRKRLQIPKFPELNVLMETTHFKQFSNVFILYIRIQSV